MSLITRCPNCETLFKVVPDQLRISEGWVRCGQCDEVFDASLHLLQAPPTKKMPADLQESVLPDATEDGAQWTSLQAIPDAISPVEETISMSMELRDEQVETNSSKAPLSEPVILPGPDDHEADIDAGLAEVSFLQDDNNGAFWRQPSMRATLALLSLVLLLGLLAQIVLHERDQMVALEPGLRPWLLAACVPLNCVLTPLRRIESIVIESSSFAKLQGDSYRLNFTVKNRSDVPLAVPAIELTLTDLADQPVVRRVLLPAELGVKSETLTADVEWPISLVMTIKAVGTSDRVSGYRLLTFYP